MDRRRFLRRFARAGATTAAGVVLGSAVTQAVANPYPPHLLNSVAPRSQRGRTAVYWSVDTTDRAIALTFDDGPTTQYTTAVLDILAEHDARATFFMIGLLAQRHPELVERVIGDGHEVGNHSYDHVSAVRLDRAEVVDSIAMAQSVLEARTGTTVRWYRAPRGEITTATLIACGDLDLDLAFWTAQRGPRSLPDDDVAGVERHLLAAAEPGAIIDLHDGIGTGGYDGDGDARLITRRDTELAALPAVLEGWRAAGFDIVTLSDLVARQRSE